MGQEDRYPLVAVAIKKDKCSQGALRWTIDHLIKKGQTLILLHINTNASGSQQHDPSIGYNYKGAVDPQMRELFIPFRVFCTRKAVKCKDVVVEDHDVTKGIVEFVSYAAIEMLVIGGPSHSSFMRRFKGADLSTTISKGTPDFCTVYMISKTEKVISERKSIRPAPGVSQLRAQILNQASIKPDTSDHEHEVKIKGEMAPNAQALCLHDESIKSPFCRGNPGRKYADHYSKPEIDITYVSSGRPSIDKAYPPRLSNHSNGPFDYSFESTRTPPRSADTYSFGNDFSPKSGISSVASWQSQNLENVDAEMMRLRWEFKHNMEMYNTSPYREATMAFVHNELRQKEHEERVALAFAEKKKAAEKEKAAVALKEKEHAAMEAAKMQKKVSDQQIRTDETQKKNAVDTFVRNKMYRRYTIEEIEKATNNFAENLKVGEGGYGPVYKCYLDHTHVAVKVLRPDAAQGRTQFLQEVEVLSCMRHPNMVILLGACPEYGCLVYEYMAKGSLEDRLYRRGNTPPIPWQHRFRIAAEIATGLLFLHQAKPEPLVHRDLKPGNILLDRNYVSKISDVGLARLIPPSIADSVIQYRMTSAAGTFCYIDPEYQQTGMLGVKSDVYSLGIMLLQIITAKPPMGLTHYVTGAIEKGAFREVLDPSIKDWPVQEAMRLAEIALKCTELQKKDRPDLAEDVLPELERLSALGEEDMDDWF